MTDHLSHAILNALVDGELTADQLASASQHLAGCPSCTSYALHESILKSATAKAGQRYLPPPHLQERLARLALREDSRSQAPGFLPAPISPLRSIFGFRSLGWSAAALLLLASVSMMLFQRASHRAELASAERAALVSICHRICRVTLRLMAPTSPTCATDPLPSCSTASASIVSPSFSGRNPARRR
jgi:anti-sigma factor RsiW